MATPQPLDNLGRVTQREPEESKSTHQGQAISTGTGVALGAGLGTVVFAMTDDPIWIALGTGLGAAVGAALGGIRRD